MLLFYSLHQISGIRPLNGISVFRGYWESLTKWIPPHLWRLTRSNCVRADHTSREHGVVYIPENGAPHRCFPSREIWEHPKHYECSLPQVTHEFSQKKRKKTQVDYLHEAIIQDLLLLSLLHGGQGEPIYPIPLHSPLMLAYLDKTGWVP